VAEITAAMLLSQCGIEVEGTFNNSVSYLQSWIRALQNDKKMIVWAAGKAEAATKWILGIRQEQEAQDAAAEAA
jgi:antirestriction protein ArdC